jgi:hypothetical protein
MKILSIERWVSAWLHNHGWRGDEDVPLALVVAMMRQVITADEEMIESYRKVIEDLPPRAPRNAALEAMGGSYGRGQGI